MPLKKQSSVAEIWYNTLTSQHITESSSPSEPWTDLYAPEDIKDVAVHHEKLKEVKEVCRSLKARKSCILVITGPPGSSKSTCLQTVCQSLGFSSPIVWEETDCDYNETGSSDYDKFEEFLLKSTRYSITNDSLKLDFRQTANTVNSRPSQLVLVENLPIGLTEKPARFHNILRAALSHVLIPTLLAFVLTKSSSNGCFGVPNISSFDNGSLGRLFPPNIVQELGVYRIEFNPIASTIMTRAINRIVNIVCKKLKIPLPSKAFIQSLAASSSGDIRLAINNLQFALMSAKQTGKSSAMEYCVYERDAGLALFHALGKILHSKRLSDSDDQCLPLPSHLQAYKRPPLSFNPESVLDQSGLSGDDAVAWLHENYLLFHTNSDSESLNSLALTSTQISWSDAHLSGGMNWRLGLTPAADRNSGVCMAGSHYAAMVTARCIAFRSPGNVSGTVGNRFRPLKAPQSKSVENSRRDSWEALRTSLSGASGARFKDVLVAGLRTSLLDRFPLELKILGTKYPGDKQIVSSICLFRNRENGFERPNKRRADHFANEPPQSAQRYHLYDNDETEGVFTNIDLEAEIDEDFSDEDQR
nr:cell cycle checkpoint protein rad17 [Hymenolepis microstoma]